MVEADLLRSLAFAIGLGLIGFIEPYSIGTTLNFIKTLKGKIASNKLAQVRMFMSVRALSMEALGLAAVGIGTAFIGFQKAAWIVFGAAYALIRFLYVAGKSGLILRLRGPGLARLSSVNGAGALGALFEFNIPACAAPFVLALVGIAIAGGAAALATGFLSLALFGLALSLPIMVVALFPRARAAHDWLAGLSRRIPFWTGIACMVLGLWSIWFSLNVSIVSR